MINKEREQHKIILDLVITSIVFIVFLTILLFPVFTNVSAISSKKEEFNKFFNIYNNLLSKGLPYDSKIEGEPSYISIFDKDDVLNKYSKLLLTYNSIEKTGISSSYYKEFLEKFTNGEYKDFNKFIEYKKSDIFLNNNLNNFDIAKNIISKILPRYEEGISLKSEYINGLLLNFDFINGIEKLLNKYNIINNSKLGISQIVKIENSNKDENNLNNSEDILNKDKNTLNNDFEIGLYYIPLNLDLKGNKASFINFLEDIINSGNLYLNKSGELFYKDEKGLEKNIFELKENGKDLVKAIDDYNQLVSIESISMSEYMDDAVIYNENTFLESIKKYQNDENFSINLKLRFYVSGISNLEISNITKNIFGNNDEFNIINSFENILTKKNEELNIKEQLYLDYYNLEQHSIDNKTEISFYTKLKLRIIKYKKILSDENNAKKYDKDFVNNSLTNLNQLYEKLTKEYYEKDISTIISDTEQLLNIRENTKKIENYLDKFKLIEEELNFIEKKL